MQKGAKLNDTNIANGINKTFFIDEEHYMIVLH